MAQTLEERIAAREKQLADAKDELKELRKLKRKQDRERARLREQVEALELYRLPRDHDVRFRNGNTGNALAWVSEFVREHMVEDNDARETGNADA